MMEWNLIKIIVALYPASYRIVMCCILVSQDKRLRRAVEKFGPRWQEVAEFVGDGVSPPQVLGTTTLPATVIADTLCHLILLNLERVQHTCMSINSL
jgi:hypothetical protein